ncbi:FMN-binding protein [Actinomyces oricola]|mgnify:FL=1|uniref:FMN-binding protein n=1 Tax=Actinomyces oricola TaxID=206043 RepID=UPI001F4FDA71|nr:FMN-binding protein [Actinomyces oricola]
MSGRSEPQQPGGADRGGKGRVRATRGGTARAAAALTGVVLSAVGVAACGGGEVTPGDDEYAGRPQDSQSPAAEVAQGAATGAPPAPTGGPYADGSFSASESYGVVDDLIEEDSIDVTATLSGGVITDVSVTGHALTSTSRDHLTAFIQEIEGAVEGRSVEDAHVTALAGASKTSEAFNDAIDSIAEQSREAAAASS